VMDLGVARLQDEVVRLSQTGAFVGSLEYACPEQFSKGGEGVDARSDLYALGVMLYELSTGQHPCRTDDTSTTIHNVIEGKPRRAGEVNPQLSPFFEEVVHTLAAKEPGERFSSASTLLAALEGGEKSDWWRERARVLRIQTKRPLRRIRIPRETALYGRDDDLAKLRALYEKAKGGDGQMLLIEGEAGIGKTRVVDEFVGRLKQDGEDVNFLFGSYPPGGAATASGAFSEAYREQFGAEGLEDTLKEYLTPTPILIPAFAAILKGETTPTGAEPLTKDSLQTVFVHATRALAAERTTVVLIDDLHFAPEDGRALFASLALAVPGHRILLVGTMRPGVPEEWMAGITRLEHAEHRSLARLGPKDLAKLLEEAFHSERLATELGHKIALKCDGNPFFAFEIIRGLREGQFISQRPDGTWVTTRVIHDIQVPSSVLDLVNARVADLSEEERDLLDVASCCGFEFDPTLVGHVLGLPRVDALKRFGQVERRHRLVRSAGRDYRFDHHQVQEALYGSLNERLREEYHAIIAESLSRSAGVADRAPQDLEGSLCVDLCDHYLKGAKGDEALRYLDAALDHLAQGYLRDQAIVLAERLLAVPDLLTGKRRLAVLLRANGLLESLARYQAQESLLAEAHALADATRDRGGMGRVERSWGLLRYFLGRYEEAKTHLERHLAIAQEIGDRADEASARGNLGNALLELGHSEEGMAQLEQALAVYREIGHRHGEAAATGSLGGALGSLGRYEEAEKHCQDALAIYREIGNRQDEAVILGNLGLLWLLLGDRDRGQGALEASLALSREIGARQVEGHALYASGAVAREEGDLTRALARSEEALSLRRVIGDDGGVAESLVELGGLLPETRGQDAAREALREAVDLLHQQQRRPELAEALALLASHPGGDAAEAEAALEEAGEAGNTPQTRYYLWRATGKHQHLAEAKRLLDYRVEHAPEEYRESMLKNVRLNREITEAWKEHGGNGE